MWIGCVLVAGAVGAMPTAAHGQGYVYPGAPVILLDDQQLDDLTGPIALYPDPLVAQILPGSTYPLEVSTADQWLHANPQVTEDAINVQNWDPSIKALVHYPEVLDMMAQRMDWTQQLGQAFINQPADVMNSIQRLRQEAQAAGTLVSTPQQEVIFDNGLIDIVPAEPDVIYVPTYDPAVVYFRHREPRRDAIRFDRGFRLGVWLDKGFDWRNHRVEVGARWDRPRERPVLTGREWHRDESRPMVVTPRRMDMDEHRGYAPRVENRAPERVQERPEQRAPEARPAPEVRPAPEARPPRQPEARAVPEQRPQRQPEARPAPEVRPAPAPAPRVAPEVHPAPAPEPRQAPRAFGTDGGRQQVEHEQSRGQGSLQHR